MKNISELKKSLEDIQVPNEIYSILKGGLPNEKLCIVKEDNVWQVYYSERGRKSGLMEFDNESDACEYFYNKIKKYAVK